MRKVDAIYDNYLWYECKTNILQSIFSVCVWEWKINCKIFYLKKKKKTYHINIFLVGFVSKGKTSRHSGNKFLAPKTGEPSNEFSYFWLNGERVSQFKCVVPSGDLVFICFIVYNLHVAPSLTCSVHWTRKIRNYKEVQEVPTAPKGIENKLNVRKYTTNFFSKYRTDITVKQHTGQIKTERATKPQSLITTENYQKSLTNTGSLINNPKNEKVGFTSLILWYIHLD